MKNLVQPASLLLYILSILVFFVMGASYAGVSGAADGQGLAGGAIVLMYGLMTAFGTLVTAIILAYYCDKKTIIRLNQILGILLLLCAIFVTFRIIQKKNDDGSSMRMPPTEVLYGQINSHKNILKHIQKKEELGMGFFKPELSNNSSLQFYSSNALDALPGSTLSVDSIHFSHSNYGDFEITSAPPWLLPHHLKLDYGILLFQVMTVQRDFVEVVGNKQTGQTLWVNRNDGTYLDWPDFLLQVFSISTISEEENPLKIRPFDYAGLKKGAFDVLEPVLIKNDWVKVKIYNADYEEQGTAWLRWKLENKLMITYSLLS